MPRFSELSLSRLKTCHPDLIILFDTVIQFFDCTILCGHRGQEAQDKAVQAGNSKTPWPTSKHNKSPSLAVDVAPYPIPHWAKTSEFIYFGGKVMGIAEMLYQQGKMVHRITYGADFNRNDRVTDQPFVDAVHFQLIT